MRNVLRAGRAALIAAVAGAILANATAVFASRATWEVFPLTCGNETFVVTSPPGFWSAGPIVDGAPGAHVVSVAYSITVTDLDTGDVLYSNGYTKPGRRGQPTLECFDYSVSTDPDTGDQIAVDFRTTIFIPSAGPA